MSRLIFVVSAYYTSLKDLTSWIVSIHDFLNVEESNLVIGMITLNHCYFTALYLSSTIKSATRLCYMSLPAL
jgi:hypothetical protein